MKCISSIFVPLSCEKHNKDVELKSEMEAKVRENLKKISDKYTNVIYDAI